MQKKFSIKDENFLRTFHNLNCPENEIIIEEIPTGTTVLIPEDPQFLIEENDYKDENDCMNEDDEHDKETDDKTEAENRTETENWEKKRRSRCKAIRILCYGRILC
ncbi:hypothetical protein [Chryseobacterium foetidum]|uniref:hypothetical protein n=1 Tax=Chryseobacterium foetidum TaxID=2951057 RepID=UPI0021C8567C|nr:hypothetical protein [Chryseobacterium foetidum]